MAIEHDNGVCGQDGIHWSGLSSTDTNRDETLPVPAQDSAARAELIKDSSRQTNQLDARFFGNARRVNGRSLRDERNEIGFSRVQSSGNRRGNGARGRARRQEVLDAQSLCCEDSIEGSERKFALSMKEVRYVGWFQARLFSENTAGGQSTIDSASDLEAEALMELGGIHLRIFVS